MGKDYVHITFPLQTIGFILFIIFLVLKFVGVITFSWFWVFFPLWSPIALSCVLLILTFSCLILKAKIEIEVEKRKRKNNN